MDSDPKYFLESLYISNFKSIRGQYMYNFKDKICKIIGPSNSGKTTLLEAIQFVLMVRIGSLRVHTYSELINDVDTERNTICFVKAIFSNGAKTVELIRSVKVTENGDICTNCINGEFLSETIYLQNIKSLQIYESVLGVRVSDFIRKSPGQIYNFFEHLCNVNEYEMDHEKLKIQVKGLELEIRAKYYKIKKLKYRQNALKAYNLQKEIYYLENKWCFLKMFYIDKEISKLDEELTDRQVSINKYKSQQTEFRQCLLSYLDVSSGSIEFELVQQIFDKMTSLCNNKLKSIHLFSQECEHNDYMKILHVLLSLIKTSKDNCKKYSEEMVNFNLIASSDFDVLQSDHYEQYKRLLKKYVEFSTENFSCLDINDKIEEYFYKIELMRNQALNNTNSRYISREKQIEFLTDGHIKNCKNEMVELEHRLEVLKGNIKVIQHEMEINDFNKINKLIVNIRKSTINNAFSNYQKLQIMDIENLRRELGANVIGLLRTLIEPNHETFIAAVDSALYLFTNVVIVDTKETIVKCIEILNRNTLIKRVRNYIFLHLSDLEIIRYASCNTPNLPEVANATILPLYECIEYPDQLDHIIKYITRNIFLCNSYDDVKKFSEKYNATFISCDGRMIDELKIKSYFPSKIVHVSDDIVNEWRNLLVVTINDVNEKRSKIELIEKEIKQCELSLYNHKIIIDKYDNFVNLKMTWRKEELQERLEESNVKIKKFEEDRARRSLKLKKEKENIFKTFCKKLQIENVEYYETHYVNRANHRKDLDTNIEVLFDFQRDLRVKIVEKETQYVDRLQAAKSRTYAQNLEDLSIIIDRDIRTLNDFEDTLNKIRQDKINSNNAVKKILYSITINQSKIDELVNDVIEIQCRISELLEHKNKYLTVNIGRTHNDRFIYSNELRNIYEKNIDLDDINDVHNKMMELIDILDNYQMSYSSIEQLNRYGNQLDELIGKTKLEKKKLFEDLKMSKRALNRINEKYYKKFNNFVKNISSILCDCGRIILSKEDDLRRIFVSYPYTSYNRYQFDQYDNNVNSKFQAEYGSNNYELLILLFFAIHHNSPYSLIIIEDIELVLKDLEFSDDIFNIMKMLIGERQIIFEMENPNLLKLDATIIGCFNHINETE